MLDYSKTKGWLASKYAVHPSDPDFEDRYHDCWEKYLRSYDPESGVHPLTAMNTYYQNWYRDHRHRKEYERVALLEDLIREMPIQLEVGDEWETYISDRYGFNGTDCTYEGVLTNEVQSAINLLTDYQRDVLLRRMNDETFEDIASVYSVSHQAIQLVYRKVTKKLLDILV